MTNPSRSEILHSLTHPGVIAIIRASTDLPLTSILEAFADGGLKAVEVTMTTPGALQAISELRKSYGKKLLIGVGTVLDSETCRAAILAGAQFVVTPIYKPELVLTSRRYGVPIMAGAYTPTEILAAWEGGADFVKVFPADGLGANYIKAVKAPLPQVEIVPTGGVDASTAGSFIKAGCAAVAAGSSLLSKKMIDEKNWKGLAELSAQFVESVAKARKEFSAA
jgi:2-dehydro-3-deoxyphosphogluconate aldolase / (4S)-4-hydroxy-2-oxoglutarate aldolase